MYNIVLRNLLKNKFNYSAPNSKFLLSNWEDNYIILYRVYKKKLHRFEIALKFVKQLLVSSFLCI